MVDPGDSKPEILPGAPLLIPGNGSCPKVEQLSRHDLAVNGGVGSDGVVAGAARGKVEKGKSANPYRTIGHRCKTRTDLVGL